MRWDERAGGAAGGDDPEGVGRLWDAVAAGEGGRAAEADAGLARTIGALHALDARSVPGPDPGFVRRLRATLVAPRGGAELRVERAGEIGSRAGQARGVDQPASWIGRAEGPTGARGLLRRRFGSEIAAAALILVTLGVGLIGWRLAAGFRQGAPVEGGTACAERVAPRHQAEIVAAAGEPPVGPAAPTPPAPLAPPIGEVDGATWEEMRDLMFDAVRCAEAGDGRRLLSLVSDGFLRREFGGRPAALRDLLGPSPEPAAVAALGDRLAPLAVPVWRGSGRLPDGRIDARYSEPAVEGAFDANPVRLLRVVFVREDGRLLIDEVEVVDPRPATPSPDEALPSASGVALIEAVAGDGSRRIEASRITLAPGEAWITGEDGGAARYVESGALTVRPVAGGDEPYRVEVGEAIQLGGEPHELVNDGVGPAVVLQAVVDLGKPGSGAPDGGVEVLGTLVVEPLVPGPFLLSVREETIAPGEALSSTGRDGWELLLVRSGELTVTAAGGEAAVGRGGPAAGSGAELEPTRERQRLADGEPVVLVAGDTVTERPGVDIGGESAELDPVVLVRVELSPTEVGEAEATPAGPGA